MKRYLFILSLLLISMSLVSQTDEVIKVGLKQEPPFVIKASDGTFSGLSIDLWKLIADEQKVKYEFKEYSDNLGLIRALDFREIDMCINPMHVNEIRLKILDVTQPFYVSYIGVATTHINETKIGGVIRNLFSFRLLRVLFFLLFLIIIFGTFLWVVERKENRRQFRPGVPGLFDGLWWSAVTMTTVGYGDKAPKTKMGRVIAIVWMLTAIVTISGFTGTIASTMTVQSLERSIEDLGDLRNSESIGTVISSSSEAFLKRNNIQPDILYNNVQKSLNALSAKKVKVLVYDKSVLDYYISQMQLNNKVVLLPVNFNQQYQSFFLPKNSQHFSWVNALLVRTINDPSWQKLMMKYNLQVE